MGWAVGAGGGGEGGGGGEVKGTTMDERLSVYLGLRMEKERG